MVFGLGKIAAPIYQGIRERNITTKNFTIEFCLRLHMLTDRVI